MSDRKQFLIFCLGVSVLALLIWFINLANEPPPKDNVINFKINTTGTIVKYTGSDEIVELPYMYKRDKNGNAVFGTAYKVLGLGANAFEEDNKITRIALSIFIQTIEDGAFDNLDNVETLVFRGEYPPVISGDEIDKLTNLKYIYVYSQNLDNYLSDAVFSSYQDIIKVI